MGFRQNRSVTPKFWGGGRPLEGLGEEWVRVGRPRYCRVQLPLNLGQAFGLRRPTATQSLREAALLRSVLLRRASAGTANSLQPSDADERASSIFAEIISLESAILELMTGRPLNRT
jgi:hypothetical protein